VKFKPEKLQEEWAFTRENTRGTKEYPLFLAGKSAEEEEG